MDDLLRHFIVEARELTQQATDDLLALERAPTIAAHMDSAFRAVHTLKGSVALFDFAPMGLALHAAEDLLGAIRGDGEQSTATWSTAFLNASLRRSAGSGAIEQTGQLPPDAAEEDTV
jgi:two-component system chemotaxis sensor kinase CheA